MTTDFLQQDDIDALMGMGSGDAESNSQLDGQPVRFEAGEGRSINRAQIPAIDIVNDVFARHYQRALSSFLKTNVSVSSVGVAVKKMKDYMSNLLLPSSLNIVKLHPFDNGSMTVVMEAGLIYRVLNLRYGGEPDYHYKIEGKDFHQLEKDFIQEMLLSVFQCYQMAWEPIQEVSIEVLHSDTNPQYERSISPNEMVYVSRMKVSLDGGGGEIHFCIPSYLLAPHIKDLEQKEKRYLGGSSSTWEHILKTEAGKAHVVMDCKIGQSVVVFDDLVNLEVGSIIPINMFDKSVLLVEGLPMFVGEHGISEDGFKSLKITDAIKHP